MAAPSGQANRNIRSAMRGAEEAHQVMRLDDLLNVAANLQEASSAAAGIGFLFCEGKPVRAVLIAFPGHP